MSMRENNPTFPLDGDLDSFIIEYGGDMFQNEDPIHQYDIAKACEDGQLSLWEIFEASFARMCKDDDLDNLRYILEEAPNYNVDLTYSRYTYLDDIIRKNSHQVLIFFIEKNLVPLNNDFFQHFETKNYPKNIATSIIDTCIFNAKLEDNLVKNQETPIKRKI